MSKVQIIKKCYECKHYCVGCQKAYCSIVDKEIEKLSVLTRTEESFPIPDWCPLEDYK